MSESIDERLEMVNDFVNESRDLLDEIEPQIIAMEESSSNSGLIDNELLNGIFRLFHSIKGMASFLDLQTVMNVTHEAETLLDIFRKNQLPLDTKHVELLYRTSDFIRNLLDNIEHELNDGGFEDAAQNIIGEIKDTISSVETNSSPVEVEKEIAETRPLEIQKPDEKQSVVDNPEDFVPASSLVELKIIITPEMVKRFIDEALENFEEAETALLKLEDEPDNKENIEQVFRAFHSFKGNAGFFGYSDFEQVSHKAENLLDEIRDCVEKPTAEIISALLTVIDALRGGIARLNAGENQLFSEKERLINCLEGLKLNKKTTPNADDGISNVDNSRIKPYLDLSTEDMTETGNSPSQENQNVNVCDESSENKDNGKQNDGQPKNDNGKKVISAGQQAIRVDIEKLDSLLDLVGELVIAEAIVSHNPDLQGLELARFDKAVLQLGKITREIQDVSMSMRMIPLAGTFRKMVRLIRDLSLKENKKVALDIIGEETEVDKTIIEQISDPLVHLIRNAVDHGLEAPEERAAAGKPEAGTVTLEAKHAAGEVLIIVKDDGRGLNREKILQKAKAKGLITDENREMKDEEVWKLIFEPGLSTAEQVSSISGRGVGMDVVKRNIEKLKGKVDVRSVTGEGTLIVVRIPLTLAIIEGMVVRVGDTHYTIPIVTIRKSFQPRESEITITPDGLEIVSVRGELLPVFRLHELYQVKPDYEKLTEGILVIVESDSQKCCLFVDELVGQQQIVIKGLPEYLGNVRGVSGCAILGDGEVSMILDITNLINSAEGLLEMAKNINSNLMMLGGEKYGC